MPGAGWARDALSFRLVSIAITLPANSGDSKIMQFVSSLQNGETKAETGQRDPH
jgi:hypothetical protein